jgi:tRNA A37 threonylcarbamoyladenosine biosynthesis protein TsaE
LQDASEARHLTLEDAAGDDAVVIVEWGDRVLEALPSDIMRVRIDMIDETRRRIRIEAPPGWVIP